MFLQAACVVKNEESSERKVNGLLHSCIVVFICLCIINYVDYIKREQENAYVEWDVKTITAGDYTIEFILDSQFFQAFLDL